MRKYFFTILFLMVTFPLIADTKQRTAITDCGKQPIKLAFFQLGLVYDNGVGVDKDIVDELAKRTGCKFETQLMARARIWNDLESGDLDMGTCGIQNAARDKFAWFAHYMVMKNYAVINLKAAKNIKSASDFIANQNLQLGVVTSFKHGPDQDKWIEDLRKMNRVQYTAEPESILKKIKDERVDAMFSQLPVFKKFIKEFGMENDVVVQDWTPNEKVAPQGLILSKHRFSKEDAAKWQEVINEMKTDGTLKKIYMHYFSASEADQLLDF